MRSYVVLGLSLLVMVGLALAVASGIGAKPRAPHQEPLPGETEDRASSSYGLWFPLRGAVKTGDAWEVRCTWDQGLSGGPGPCAYDNGVPLNEYHCPDFCKAIDFARKDKNGNWQAGANVYAARDGIAKVWDTGSSCGGAGTHGNAVVIDHQTAGGLKTYYYHLKSISSKIVNAGSKGYKVKTTTVIGTVGHTGNVAPCSFNHLHFEAIGNGVRKNAELAACWNSTRKTYPDELGYDDWTLVPVGRKIRNDNTNC